MIKFFLFIFLFIFSCGKKEVIFDIDSFINQGKKVNLIKRENLNNSEKNLIKSLKTYNYALYNNWSEENQNSKNYLKPVKIIIENKRDQLSRKIVKFIIHENKIITIDRKSNITIYSLDFKKINSKKLYKSKIYKNYNGNFSIIAHKNNLYISDNFGIISSVNIKNLNLNWSKNFGVPFKSNLKIHQNNLFVINSNSKIFSININNGNLSWSFETSSQILKDQNSYQIAVYNNKLFFTNDSFEIYCLDLIKKNIIWSLIFKNENFENAPLISRSSPIIIDEDGSLYISSNNGNTYSIDANNGFVNWSAPIYSINRFVISKNYLFNVFDNYFLIINKKNGEILVNKKISQKEKNKKFLFKDIVVSQKKIYLFDINGYVISINKSNLINSYQVNRHYKKFLDLILVNNNLYINTGNTIYKY